MENSAEHREMAFELKKTIDQRGRYKFKLQDYSLAYAAGAGISPSEAKGKIQQSYEKEFGVGMKDYLDKTRNERDKNRPAQNQSRDLAQSRSR